MLQLKRSLLAFVWLTVLCGLIYPLAVTGAARVLFPALSGGSMIKHGETVVGSHLIGQQFIHSEYFHGRPSATDPPYDASNSGASNLAPSNAKLIAQVKNRIRSVRTENNLAADTPIPADLVLTSASGLDPHVSPAAARLQARRVAEKRKIPLTDVERLIKQNTEEPLWGIWGKARVNVLELNLALDAVKTGN
jgi:K+-transporting ATPase ATPase C chain